MLLFTDLNTQALGIILSKGQYHIRGSDSGEALTESMKGSVSFVCHQGQFFF